MSKSYSKLRNFLKRKFALVLVLSFVFNLGFAPISFANENEREEIKTQINDNVSSNVKKVKIAENDINFTAKNKAEPISAKSQNLGGG